MPPYQFEKGKAILRRCPPPVDKYYTPSAGKALFLIGIIITPGNGMNQGLQHMPPKGKHEIGQGEYVLKSR